MTASIILSVSAILSVSLYFGISQAISANSSPSSGGDQRADELGKLVGNEEQNGTTPAVTLGKHLRPSNILLHYAIFYDSSWDIKNQ